MKSGWRKIAQRVILKVLRDNQGKSRQEIRKALRSAYPFGMRKYHPYKIWLDEVKLQLGEKKPRKKREKRQLKLTQNKWSYSNEIFEKDFAVYDG